MVREIGARAAWEALERDPAARLCDVRTEAEWRGVGVPDLSLVGKQVDFVSWAKGPTMAVNESFLEELAATGATHDAAIYFICRSGARSMSAAMAAEAAGYGKVYNVVEGYEGRPGATRGWAAQGLPRK